MFPQELIKHRETLQNLSKKINKEYSYQFKINLSEGVTVTSRCGKTESIEHHNNNTLGVQIFCEDRQGFSTTNNLSVESIGKTIEKAKNISNNTQPDIFNGLPENNFVKGDNIPKLDLYHPSNLDINQIIKITHECEKSAFDYDKRISNSEGTSFSYGKIHSLILNSKGAHGMSQGTNFSLSCIVLAEEERNKERDYEYSTTRDFKKLESPRKIGIQAAENAILRLGAKTIKTRVCPVLFSPEMSASIFGHFLSAIKGAAIYKRASFLLDQIDKRIFPDHINITEEPHLEDGMGSSPYDGEGVITEKKDIIQNGKLKTYLLDTYSAKRLNSISTANKGLITNIVIDSIEKKTSNIMSNIKDGIYITEMMGSGVNTLTGDYSRGAFGYLIRDGKIIHPVNGITVASNLQNMFKNIIAIGDDIDRRSNINTGSILINDITIGGSS